QGRALDLILTGRGVTGVEAERMGLVNRLVPKGQSLTAALDLAPQLAALPQAALRSDRLSAYEQWSLSLPEALAREYRHGMSALSQGEIGPGLERFAAGEWRRAR